MNEFTKDELELLKDSVFCYEDLREPRDPSRGFLIDKIQSLIDNYCDAEPAALAPLTDNNKVVNLIARVENISSRAGLIRKIANEYEDHIDDVLDELDDFFVNYLFEQLDNGD